LKFTPDNEGQYRVDLTATDDDGGTGTISQIVAIANAPPTASPLSIAITEDLKANVRLLAYDVPADILTYSIIAAPLHGTLSGIAQDLIYTPVSDYHGSDLFTYQVSDGQATSDVATATITIAAVNDPPVFAKGANQSVTD